MILVFLFQFTSLSNLLCFSFSCLFILVYQGIGSLPHQNWLKVFFFMTEQYSMVYIYYNFFIHSSVKRYLGCFHVLAIVNSAAMNIAVHVSFSIMVSSGHMLSSGIVGSYGSFLPSFPRTLPTVLHSGYINLHFTKSARGFPFLHILFSIYYLYIF